MRRLLYIKINFDCILMDIQMPEMDGYEATSAIRSFEQAKAKAPIFIIAMTAHAMKGIKRSAWLRVWIVIFRNLFGQTLLNELLTTEVIQKKSSQASASAVEPSAAVKRISKLFSGFRSGNSAIECREDQRIFTTYR